MPRDIDDSVTVTGADVNDDNKILPDTSVAGRSGDIARLTFFRVEFARNIFPIYYYARMFRLVCVKNERIKFHTIHKNMDPITSRWSAYQSQRDVGMPPLHDPTIITPTCGGLRVRREYAARDAVNTRAWDFFRATPPTQISSTDLQSHATQIPVYMDMNPINSRTDANKYRMQPEYMPDPPRPTTTSTDLGIPPKPSAQTTIPPNGFSQNSYTQRLDAGGDDGRNMIRELRSAVVEDNRDRHTDSSRALTERQFNDRWLPPLAASDAGSLQAYELLRPKQDEWRKMKNT